MSSDGEGGCWMARAMAMSPGMVPSPAATNVRASAARSSMTPANSQRLTRSSGGDEHASVYGISRGPARGLSVTLDKSWQSSYRRPCPTADRSIIVHLAEDSRTHDRTLGPEPPNPYQPDGRPPFGLTAATPLGVRSVRV